MLNKTLALALAALVAQPALADGPVVKTASGAVAGVAAEGVDAFLGLPFAAPPVGPLRWRAPQPAAAWKGVRPANRLSNDCMQHPIPGPHRWSTAEMSEDCLYLNLWRPAAARPGARLPVMVWIYGGGFSIGSGAWPIFNGTNIARQGVILVNFNYRLGRFGLFAHPALMDQAKIEPLANYAVMDQIAALKWVKRNIAAFGGDPDNVTIFGESAGGISVNMLMTAPAARGLFAKAITQSGGGSKMTGLGSIDQSSVSAMGPRPSAIEAGQAFATTLGLANATAEQLRAVPAARILGQGVGMTRDGGPVIDGKLLIEDPVAAFQAGRQAKVPYIVGTTSLEASVMGAGVDPIFAAAKAPADKIAALYTGYGTRDPRWVRAELVGDLFMVAGARRLARTQAATGAPVYSYQFDYVVEPNRAQAPGTPHGGEIAYIFGTYKDMPQPEMPTDAAFSQRALRYWTQFAKTGNPNGEDLPEWPRFVPETEAVMVLANDGAKPQPFYRKDRLDLVESLGF